MHGHSVTKSFYVGRSPSVISSIVSANSDKESVSVDIIPTGKTSFTDPLEFSFTPKINGLYEIMVTNLGSRSIDADVDISYPSSVKDKLAESGTHLWSITIASLVIITGLFVIMASIIGYNKLLDRRWLSLLK